MKKILVIPLFGLIFLICCELRPLPESQIGEVRFFATGEIGGEVFRREAGKEEYFLHTGKESDAQGLSVYWGRLSPRGCMDCPGSLEIRFRDLRRGIEANPFHMDSLLRPGKRQFYFAEGVEGRLKKRVSFFNEGPDDPGVQYQWNFGDGEFSSERNPVHVYQNPELEDVEVCLEALPPSGCRSVVCNELDLRDSTCRVDFDYVIQDNSTYVSFDAQVKGKSPFTYQWTFGDGGRASLANPGYFYLRPDRYRACLRVEDALGCRVSLCKNIAVDPELCTYNYNYRISSVVSKDTLQGGRIEILYVGEGGKTYSTSWGRQEGPSFFELLQREPYEANEDGLPTYAFDCEFSCRLWTKDGEALRLNMGRADFAVGY